jgi:broad specificity phosphatase PhoE
MSDEQRYGQVEKNRDDIAELNKVVFNGYGERIKDTQRRVTHIEKQFDALSKKLNWIIVTAGGAVIMFLLDLLKEGILQAIQGAA